MENNNQVKIDDLCTKFITQSNINIILPEEQKTFQPAVSEKKFSEHEIDNICADLYEKGKDTCTDDNLDNIIKNTNMKKDDIKNRINQISNYKSQLKKLIEKPVIKQRTEEWYEARKNIITASDFAQALGKGKFGSVKQFYRKKCGEDTFMSNEYVIWGNMFEDVAISIYKDLYKVEMFEFGLIKDENTTFFGASPDAISSNGIMIEIKCPKKREIKGDVPLQYYYQIMGQLKACDLMECDYFECAFSEIDEEDFINNDYQYYGIILTKEDGSYEYSKLNDTKENMIEWAKNLINNKDLNIIEEYNPKIFYWYLNKYNIKRIIRDDEFIKENIKKLEEVWKKILKYREDQDLYKKEIGEINKRPKKYKKLMSGYSFLEEQD